MGWRLLLLCNNAWWVKQLVEEYKPNFGSVGEYLAFLDRVNIDQDVVSYDDGRVRLTFGGE